MKYLFNILLLCLCINAKAQQSDKTEYYYYYGNKQMVNGKNIPSMDDEIIMIVYSQNTTKCYYYGTSDEFMDAREGFLPGFITLEATNTVVKDGNISLRFNSTDHDFYSQPIEPFLHTEKEIKSAGYRLWRQASMNAWAQIVMEGRFNSGSTLSLKNITFYPNDTKVFRRVSKAFVTSTYKRSLITTDLERENNINSSYKYYYDYDD